MIARIWRGTTAADRAQEYLGYLRKTGLADYAAAYGWGPAALAANPA